MTLNEILDKNYLSIRAYNVCGGNDLYNLDLILAYYLKNYSFKKLRNCGIGTDKELICFCKNQLSKDKENKLLKQEGEKEVEPTFEQKALELSRKQREIINSFIDIKTNGLSIRSLNAVKLHLKKNFKIKNFSEKFLDSNIDISNIKNVGKKSIPEIVEFIDIIKKLFEAITFTKNETRLNILRNKFLIQSTFHLNKIPDEIFETNLIFRLTDYLLKQNILFSNRQTLLIIKTISVYENTEEFTIDEIAEELDLSRERVRQLRKKALSQLIDKLCFIRNFNDDLYTNYGIDINSSLLFIDVNLKEKINRRNETTFSKSFLTYLIYCYLGKSFDLIGDIEDVLQNNFFKNRNRHNWKSLYLISFNISTTLNFKELIEDISSRLQENINETYTFNFRSYLSKFLRFNEIEKLNDLMPIAEKIIFEELNVILDLDDNISFKRNTHKLAYEYALEALEKIGEPSKVKEIVNKVGTLHPNYETTESKMRVGLKRKHGFVPVGRKSVFGLKKWEKEHENFKGGTIRTITEEFLSGFDEPLHKKEITKHVKQFRPKTNANSIYNNLYIDESLTFVFFENYHIGLSRKIYSDNFKLLSKKAPSSKRTWKESYYLLLQFTEENERFPFSSGCPEEEQKLYRWFNVQKGKIENNNLSQEQINQINFIENKFENIKSKLQSYNTEKYEELREFVKNNHRLPVANKENERKLYAFHYKQRKKFESSELEDEDEQKLIDVALLLQKTIYD